MAGPVAARSLSPSEALARALNNTGATAGAHRAPVHKTPLMTVGAQDSPALYVFDQGEQGYLIVSADDVAAPILGYSTTGTFDPENIPDNMRWWLSQYEAEIEAAANEGDMQYAASSRAERAPIAPLVKTTWDQSTPYNTYCPKINGQLTVTGCVATAMAQAMSYHKWPETFDADFTYQWTSGGSTLSWKQAGVKLDWANMLDSYRGSYSTGQGNAVAMLMRACGYSVMMDYGVGASGAATIYTLPALVNDFGYDKGTYVAMREYYSLPDWENTIYDNLTNCGPVIYAGSNSEVGHCFVCDGYSRDGYFHFNWGWSGMSDGYFRLTALDPDSQGIGGSTAGYNVGQLVILGLQKPVEGSKLKINILCEGKVWAEAENGIITFRAIDGGFYNYSSNDVTGSFGIRIINDATGEIDNVTGNDATYQMFYGSGGMRFSGLADGTYRMYPIFKPVGEEAFVIPSIATEPGYVIVKYANGKLEATSPEMGRFSVRDLTLDTPMYDGVPFIASGSALWTGEFSATNTVYGVLMNGTVADSIIAIGAPMQLEFPAESEPVEFTYQSKWIKTLKASISAGNYYFSMAIDDPGAPTGVTLLTSPIPVSYMANPGAPNTTLANWNVVDRTNVNPDNLIINADIKCNSGYFFDYIIAAVFNGDGMNVGQFNSKVTSITPGETKTITINGQLPNAKAGETYNVALFNSQGKQMSMGIRITIGDRSGINDIVADSSKGITASPNPAVDYTVITAASEISSVDFVSLAGSAISVPVEIDGASARADVSSLAPGLYIARVVTANGMETVKIIKK